MKSKTKSNYNKDINRVNEKQTHTMETKLVL